MNNHNQKRPYTPQFSETATVTVYRFAKAIKKPMTNAVDIMVQLLPLIVDRKKVCDLCQDKTHCQLCAFSNQFKPLDPEVLEAVV